jgi:hypothetical protein
MISSCDFFLILGTGLLLQPNQLLQLHMPRLFNKQLLLQPLWPLLLLLLQVV